MTRLVSAELFKLRRRLMTQILAFLVIAFFVAIQIPRWDSLRHEDQTVEQSAPVERVGPDGETRVIVMSAPRNVDRSPQEEAALREQFLKDTVNDNLAVLRWVAVLCGIALVAGALGSEYTWGTLRPFLTCVESRTKYLGAKLIALELTVLAGMAVALALAFVSSLIVAAVSGGVDLGYLDGAYLLDAFFDFGRAVVGVTPYLLIAALGAVAGRSALLAAFVGLGLLIGDEIATSYMRGASNWVRHVPDFLLGRNADALAGIQFTDIGQRDPWLAGLVLASYGLGALALALWVFHRRDVTA